MLFSVTKILYVTACSLSENYRFVFKLCIKITLIIQKKFFRASNKCKLNKLNYILYQNFIIFDTNWFLRVLFLEKFYTVLFLISVINL